MKLCNMHRRIARRIGNKAACAALCGLGLLLLAGCGGSGNRQALEGTVTFDGEPLAGVSDSRFLPSLLIPEGLANLTRERVPTVLGVLLDPLST